MEKSLIKWHSRESVLYLRPDGKSAEVVVYTHEEGAVKYWIDTKLLRKWLDGVALSPQEVAQVINEVREFLGAGQTAFDDEEAKS